MAYPPRSLVTAAVGVGDVIRVSEADYAYGLGPLVLRVTEVDVAPHPKLEWLRIRGVEITWNGADGNARDVMVRVSALRRSDSEKK